MKSEWQTVRAADFMDFNPRLSIKKGTVATKISMDKLRPFTKAVPSVEQAEFSGGTKFANGDTIMARITPCLENGKTAFVDCLRENEIAFGSTEFIVLRAKPGVSDPQFVYYLATSPEFRNVAIKSMVGSSGRQRVQQPVLENLELTVPKLPEQEKIGHFLAELDDKIALNERVNDNLQKQLYEIYKAWYQDFLCIDNLTLIESPYGKIPQGWHYSMLGDLCKSVSVTHDFNTERLIFLNTGDVEDGMFLHSDYMAVADMPGQAKKTIMQNDILYSEIRPINRHFAYVDFQADNYVVSTKLMVIRATSFDSRRLYHFLTLQDTLEELQMQAESRSGTFPQIRFENISKLPILIADSNTETAFVTLLHAAYNQIEHNNSENKKLSELRNSLLPQLMSGKIDVSRIRL
jgi:type I restriction enzyme S subunit